MLRAADEFYKQYNKLPGWYDDQIEADIPLLKVIVNKLLSDTGLTLTIEEDYIHEFCSYGGAEIHSIAAFMGGVAAQEIIKLITGQYIPIQNTYIYNGCTQNSLVLDL
ncbi:NAE1 [Bugula neritina]|uniref:NAE1 n=1 Tax=Bugula neritina TaxID=10212 RepID=A0A7J7J2W1_BUGNE|nr:NAE1 [Bugula neritina]